MIQGAILQGIRAVPIDIQVGLSSGRGFKIVGLPQPVVKEAGVRLFHALPASGFEWPKEAITINLAPAGLQKREEGLDLALALAILVATRQIPGDSAGPVYAFGELSLDGRVRGCRGALSVGRMVPDKSLLIAPEDNRLELALLRMLSGAQKDYVPLVVSTLAAAAAILARGDRPLASAKKSEFKTAIPSGTDFKLIKGQQKAKRALEVAAAGGHNVLLIGPPGEGKTLLAGALPTVLPELEPAEVIELTEIYSVKGLLTDGKNIVLNRPYRQVHHQASSEAIIGGGQGFPQPGEITLAHRGVLFMDELPLFGPALLDTLRQPLEDGVIHVTRVAGKAMFPCQFVLVAAMNPCLCGFDGEFLCGDCGARITYGKRECSKCGSTNRRPRCRCGPSQVARYQSRLSGPILDRIDLKVRLSPLSGEERFIYASGDSSKAIRSRVEVARAVQKARFKGTPISANAWIPGGHVNEYCELHPSARRAMEEVSTSVPGLTMRGFDQLLKLGRTVADLNGSALIYKKHIEEAADLSGHEDVAEVLAKYHDVGNCPGCGMKADAGDRFCRRCGLGLIEVER